MSKRAKDIVGKILYITLATSTKNGIPWNSPLCTAFDKDYNFYWTPDWNGQHSKNSTENDNIFWLLMIQQHLKGREKGYI